MKPYLYNLARFLLVTLIIILFVLCFARVSWIADLACHFMLQYAAMAAMLCIVFLSLRAKRKIVITSCIVWLLYASQIAAISLPRHIIRSNSFEDLTVLQFNVYYGNKSASEVAEWIAGYDTDEPLNLQADPLAVKAGAAITPVLEEATLTTLAGLRLVDFHGIVVAGHEEIGKSLMGSEEVATALKGEYAALLRARHSKHDLPSLASISRGTGLRVFVAMPILKDNRVLGAVLLSRSPRNILKGLYDNRRSVLIAASIIISMVPYFLVKTMTGPTKPLCNRAKYQGKWCC